MDPSGSPGALFNELALVLCTFSYGILSGTLTSESGAGDSSMNESAVPTLAVSPFFIFFAQAPVRLTSACALPVFDGNGMVFVDDNHFGPAVQFPAVLAVNYSIIF